MTEDEIREALRRLEEQIAELRRHVMSAPADAANEDEWTADDERRMWARRQKPEWEPRGRLMNSLDQAGGKVSWDEWLALGERSGYEARGLNGFFTGKPPVVRREGDDVILTQRGRASAAYWRRKYGSTREG